MTDEDTAKEGDAIADGEGRAAALPEQTPALTAAMRRKIAGRYIVEGELGRGALARTLRARREDGAMVVIKLVESTSESLSRRVPRQAEAVAKLEHPHIVRVLEYGRDEQEGLFVAREFVEGLDLPSAVRSGIPSPRRLADLLMQVLSALAEAHRHGVLHGNLKPSNVLVMRDEQGRESVRLCDFGDLANAKSGAPYRSPEQLDRRQIDGQADVYAVGALLYELLTEHPPLVETREDGTRDVLAPRLKRPDRPMPRELDSLCMKALAPEPAERPRSPREMSQALRAIVALLDLRADEPLGSAAFAIDRSLAPTASTERMTVPGEQLRSRTKFWVGATLLALVCAAVFYTAEEQAKAPRERESEGPRTLPPFVSGSDERGDGRRALETGMERLRAGQVKSAVPDLRMARQALGDTPEVLRALGEALVLDGSRSEGVALLERYLELEPTARDRKFVESLIRQGEQR